MAKANTKLRSAMLLSTAAAALLATHGVAQAQLVTAGDLVDATDSGGNPGQLTVNSVNASRTDMTVLAPVVIANWTRFNVPAGTTINVDPETGLTTATLFNRVIGGDFSDISGAINAPDINFWLINQNGILFGDGAAISARSFLASTLDLSDADVFDFYEGTDLAGNGSSTLNFSGAGSAGIFGGAGTASFVTDGSLAFIGPQLDLNGVFDAGSGRVSFVTAQDVNVTFTPNSPLSFVVNAGTTVADGQVVGGSVTGAGVDFAMFTAETVTGAVLRVDANVTATAATATDNGIRLYAEGLATGTVEVDLNGTFDSNGLIDITGDGDLDAAGAITGGDVSVNVSGAASLADITASAGNIDVDAASITGTAFSATGDVTLDASNFITIDSVLADSDGNLVGDALLGQGTTPGSLTVNGPVSGAEAFLRATVVDAGNVTATNGDATVSGFNTLVGDVSATGGSALVEGVGTLTAGAVTAIGGNATLTGGSSLNAGAISATGGDVTVSATGAITTGAISAFADAGTGGAIAVRSFGGGTLGLGALTSDGDIDLDTSGSLLTGAITADGALTVGGSVDPSSVTFAGNVSVGSFSLGTAGGFAAQDLTVAAGDIVIDASTITAGAINAAAGDVSLTAAGSITTTAIGANGAIGVRSTGGGALDLGTLSSGGAVNLDTSGSLTTAAITAGGALTVGGIADPGGVTFTGNVSAASIDIDTNSGLNAQGLAATAGGVTLDVFGGNLVAGNVSATGDIAFQAPNGASASFASLVSTGGAINVFGVVPNSITVTGLTRGTSVSLVTAGGLLDLGDVQSTAGNIVLNASGNGNLAAGNVSATGGNALLFAGGSIDAGSVSATGGDVDMQAVQGITTGAISAFENAGGIGGAIGVTSTGGGALDLGTLTSEGDIALTTGGTVTTGAVSALAGMDGIAGAVDIAAGGTVDTGNIGARLLTIAGVGNITTGNITVEEALSLGVTGGDLATGNVTVSNAGATLTLRAAGAGSDVSTGALRTNGGDLLVSAEGNVTTGLVATALSGNAQAGTIGLHAGGSIDSGALAAGEDLLVAAGTSFTAASVSAGDDVLVTAGGSVNVAGLVAATGTGPDDSSVQFSGAAGASSFLFAAENTLGSNIAITGTGAIDLGSLTSARAISLDTGGALTTGAIVAGGALTVGGTTDPNGVTFTGNVTAASIDIDSAGGLDALDLEATAGGVTLDVLGGNLVAGNVSATGDIFFQAPNTATARFASLNSSGGFVAVNGAIPRLLTVTGLTRGRVVVLYGLEGITVGDVVATAGSVDLFTLNSGDVTAGNVSATGGDIDIQAVGDITTGTLTAITNTFGGAISVRSTGTGAVQTGAIDADAGVTLNTGGTLSTGGIDAGGALIVGNLSEPGTVTFTGNVTAASITVDATGAFSGQNLTATAGVIDVDAGSIDAGAVSASGTVDLVAGGNITTTSISGAAGTAGDVAIDVDSTGGGTLNLGTLTASLGAITLDTTGSITTGAIAAANGALTVGGTREPGTVTFGGNASASSITVDATGAFSGQNLTATAGVIDVDAATIAAGTATASGSLLLTAQGNVTLGGGSAAGITIASGGVFAVSGALSASGDAAISAADIDLGTAGSLAAGSNGTLQLTANAGRVIGLGSAIASDRFSLSDSELGRLSAGRLVIAGSDRIELADINFASAAGSSEVVITTPGLITITGDITGDGAGRTFRLGGGLDGSAPATRILADIESAVVDLGDATLDLRADQIVFGEQALIDAVANLSSAEIAEQFVGQSSSLLYDPIGTPRAAEYLRVGSLSVTYGEAALFQNALPRSQGNGLFSGVAIAEGGTLTLDTLDTSNAFALFGRFGPLEGSAAALAGSTVIRIDDSDEIVISATRVNGCVLGSGADCLTTVVGNFVLSVPREVVSPIVADDRLLVPFDPLVGTNNEGLFSDVAAAAGEEECEARDENGLCVDNQGATR